MGFSGSVESPESNEKREGCRQKGGFFGIVRDTDYRGVPDDWFDERVVVGPQPLLHSVWKCVRPEPLVVLEQCEGCPSWSPRPVAATVLIRHAESIPENLASSDSRHDDHGAEGDILQNHRQPLIFAILRHHLGLGAKVV
jgi:hypothetical protein